MQKEYDIKSFAIHPISKSLNATLIQIPTFPPSIHHKNLSEYGGNYSMTENGICGRATTDQKHFSIGPLVIVYKTMTII